MSDNNSLEGVAVVGLAGRFPQAGNIEQFWANIAAGKDCFTDFSVEQVVSEGIPRNVAERPDYIRRAAVLEDPAGFDARLFKYSPKEAELIDPQQRILLECACEALENAGYDPHRFPGLIGIWAGSGVNNYFLKNIIPRGSFEEIADFQTIISNDKDYLTSRIAYKLNLRGPAVVVQTACSTSLVAVNMACLALLTYQCDMALAGAVFLQTPRARGYLYHEGEIFSSDGFCRTFDSKANGTVLGEGCGLVVLRRLEDAIADRDNILAVIRGSAVNNDGAVRAGYTAPSVEGQIELMTMAQTVAGGSAEEISFIEAHGTGTPLGDPIEVSALTQVFRQTTKERAFCGLGSVKTNIGHLDVAAGIAGLIKTICALQHQQLPPTINFTEPNPELRLSDSPFYVVDKLTDWKPRNGRRIAGVSSFGMGGTNAHVIIEEYQGYYKSAPSPRHWHLLPISAATSNVLDTIGKNLSDYIKEKPDTNIADIAWTLTTGRTELRHRRCVVADSMDSAVVRLAEPNALYGVDGEANQSNRPVIFLFSGQGTQYPAMGAELYQSEPVFRESINECDRLLGPIVDSYSLIDILYGNNADISESVNQTAVSQVALFSFEYAMMRLLESYGVKPSALIGHSIGEYVAACEAGVFSLEDALVLVRERGRLMQSISPGSMIAVPLSEPEVREMLSGNLDIAVINAPNISVVSGPSKELDDFEKQMESRGIISRRLHTSHAFHSRMMEPAARAFTEIVRRVTRNAPRLPLASNFTGGWMTAEQIDDPEYWAKHLRNTVRFSENLITATNRFDSPILLEVGPGNTLCSIAKQHADKVAGLSAIPSARHPRQHAPDQAFFLRTLGALWCNGAEIDLSMLYADEKRFHVPLPVYPFEHECFWIGSQSQKSKTPPAWKLHLHWPNVAGILQKRLGMATVHKPHSLNQEALLDLWREVLGIKNLSTDDNFFEVGGHSLIAAKLFARIKEEFGISVPLSLLFDFPTVRQLMEHLSDSSERPWKSLVPIIANGDRVPLFLVHGAEGNLLLYRELATHLQPDQPVFGFQCKGVDGRGNSHEHIEDMAADYVAEIMEAYPKGPVIVGGYCMGGTVSLEIAQQLKSLGRDVPLILSIESYHYRQCGVNPTAWLLRIHAIQNIWFHAHNIILAGKQKSRGFLVQKFRVELSRIMAAMQLMRQSLARRLHLTRGEDLPHVALSKINDAAYFVYDPKPYAGRVAVFRPTKQFFGYDKYDCGWDALAPGRTDVEILPVNPRGMLVDPFAEDLACRMRKAIDNALPPGQNNV